MNKNQKEKNITDDNLMDAYMGNDAKAFRNDNLSVGTLIFGPFYFIYYKVYFLAVPVFLLEIILAYVLIKCGDYFYLILIPLAVRLFFASVFKKIYLFMVKREINDIKKYNKHKKAEEILKICQDKNKERTLMSENDAKKLVGIITVYGLILTILGIVIFIIVSNLLKNLN
jgi:hypothetical protein